MLRHKVIVGARRKIKIKIRYWYCYQYVQKNCTGFKPGLETSLKKKKRKLHIEVNYENRRAE
jgi:hypothetical protein